MSPEPKTDQKDAKPLPHSMRSRDPWPMWPFALSIGLFIVIYTWINISHRKEGRPYEPFQAMMERKDAIVEKNFYNWYSLKTSRSDAAPTPTSPAQAYTREQARALDTAIPDQLKYYMASKPTLLPGFIQTQSPDTLSPGLPLPVTLTVPRAIARDPRLQMLAFYKEGQLFLLPTLFVDSIEDIESAALVGETAPATFLIPTDPFGAETIRASLIGVDRVTDWSIKNLDPAAATFEVEAPAEEG